MSVFVDTAVIMYAGGRDHEMRRPSRLLLEAVADRRLDAATSAEVVQEIHHRFMAIGDRGKGVAMAEAALDLFGPVLPITDAIMRRMTGLVAEYPGLSSRDLIHVATCLESSIDAIVSPDRGFDRVEGVSRIDPLSIERLLV